MLDIRPRETLTAPAHALFTPWLRTTLSRSDPEENFLDEMLAIDDQ